MPCLTRVAALLIATSILAAPVAALADSTPSPQAPAGAITTSSEPSGAATGAADPPGTTPDPSSSGVTPTPTPQESHIKPIARPPTTPEPPPPPPEPPPPPSSTTLQPTVPPTTEDARGGLSEAVELPAISLGGRAVAAVAIVPRSRDFVLSESAEVVPAERGFFAGVPRWALATAGLLAFGQVLLLARLAYRR